MNTANIPQKAQWSSFTHYVLVTTGAVVGLGNIFQFPYYVSKYGGAFVLCYIIFEVLIGVPLLLAEIIIGRRGKQNPVGAISILAMETNANKNWRWIGWLCFTILFLTLTYYSVNSAFPLAYFTSLVNDSLHISPSINLWSLSSTFAASPVELGAYFLIFLLATLAVVVVGINRGLERISSLVVPLYITLFFGLAIYACSIGNFKAAVAYLFSFNPQHFTVEMIFAALTYAFFKLNIGMGCMIVYGSYLPLTTPLGRSTFVVLCLDGLVSLLAYFSIYSLLFFNNTQLLTTELTYHLMPNIFFSVPNGVLLAILFFLATTLAAWMPTIALAESVAVIIIERLGINRAKATSLIGIGAVLLGSILILSLNFHSYIQNLSVKILTPLSAVMIAIFTGWFLTKQITFNELKFNAFICKMWLFLVRYAVPSVCLGLLLLDIYPFYPFY